MENNGYEEDHARIDMRVLGSPGANNLPVVKVLIARTGQEFNVYQDQSGIEIFEYEQRIKSSRTSCHFGGFRYWLHCPGCNNRVLVLYDRDHQFKCRKCHKLIYKNTREKRVDRARTKLRSTRKKLNASPNLSIPIQKKPKGMHWKTYARLFKEERKLGQDYAKEVFSYLGLEIPT